MSIYSPMLKREEDKVYISEDSGVYTVLIGREPLPRMFFETQCVDAVHPYFPEDKSKAGGLWFILKHERVEKNDKEVITLVEDKFSTWKMMDAYRKAHDMALEYAHGKIYFSELLARFPVHSPNAKGPTRDPNHITLTKIVDNSRAVLNRDNTKLIEYIKEPVRFEL